MSVIHQIYCTHCTYNTSALQRREGPTASETAGWDARAASLRDHDLRRVYGQLGPYKYYALPRDASREDNLRYTAATAPRRLAYYPSCSGSGLRMVGQVCHRQRDSSKEGRYGGVYFSHVLASEPDDEPWSVLDCLQLWDGPWVSEDSPALPHDLETLAVPLELLQARRPALDDNLLWSFLTNPPGRSFRDPHNVIPERWKNRSAADRVALLRLVLEGHLGQRLALRREGVLLVAEPELAALLFYGVARLLPDGPLRQEISFSTYEPSPDRLNVLLAATTFVRPETSDLQREMYHGQGFVHNTFLGKTSEVSDRSRKPSAYTHLVFDIVLSHGWNDLDEFLAGLERVKVSDVHDLDLLVRLRAIAPALIRPDSPLPDLPDLRSEVCWAYLGQAVGHGLAACADPTKQLEQLAGSNSNKPILLLELMAGEGNDGDTPKTVRSLLENLRHDLLPKLLESPRVAHRFKAEAVVHYVNRHHRFPDNCPSLWELPPDNRPGGRQTEPLLEAVIVGTSPSYLERPCLDLLSGRNFSVPKALPLLVALIRVAAKDVAKTQVVHWALDQLGDDYLCELLDRYGGQLPANFPWQETSLRHRLDAILFELPFEPAKFDRRLAILEKWADHLSEPATAKIFLKAWRNFRNALEALRPERSQGLLARAAKMFNTKRPDYGTIGKELADGLWVAMHSDRYPDEPDGLLKLKCLTEIGTAVLGTPDFLPHEVRWAISSYYLSKFDGFGRWTLAPKQKKKKMR